MGHYCLEHQAVFFKKGKMKNYAHPIKGTEPTEWHPEPEGGGDEEPEPETIIEEGGTVPPYKPEPQELGMWWKEAGELVRMWRLHPETKPQYPWTDALVTAYFAHMMTVLPIKSEKGE